MASFTIERLPDEPILLCAGYDSWDWETDLEPFSSEALAALDAADGPLFVVGDLTRTPMSISEMVSASNYVTRSGKAFLRHPNMREYLIVNVGQQSLFSLAAKGLRSDLFGNVPVQVFGSVDEALDYARSH